MLQTRPALDLVLAQDRAEARGKFFFAGDQRLLLRGVTYGTFRPRPDGAAFPRPDTVLNDMVGMAANGINAVRTYTLPPRWLLNTAHQCGLYVLVGLWWEQHTAFLDAPARLQSIEAQLRAGVRACAGHPAVLGYAIGNEIPASIVRWHGRRPVERFLERLYRAAKQEDPRGLVTYVNYPTTEYLDLPFLDLLCYNVYLESQDRLEAYLARLQHLAGDRPLVLAECGLDSRSHGLEEQARSLDWQIRTVFAAGGAGIFVFAWTDEWHVNGVDVEDWDFGLTARDRLPKPALAAVSHAFAQVPHMPDASWPSISVVVCCHNGEETLRDCCEGLQRLAYPDLQVIIVNDGSRDASGSIAREYGFRVIDSPNLGLGSARNIGMEAATGEIIAYLDCDARPDPSWLTYLAHTFVSTEHAAVGGPNLAPPGDGLVADCIANAPGNPTHVLLTDRVAEHVPGCNMAIRKSCLQAVGGFDPQFRVAGDDVDMCWRIQQRGWTVGYNPAAVVWHHRRNSTRAYLRQQQGYGRAEALLELKWPEKYNAAGQISWAGRVYGQGLPSLFKWSNRVYHGVWGSAPFQSIYEPAAGSLAALPLLPEWFLVTAFLGILAAIGILWRPLLFALPLFMLAASFSLVQAWNGARRSRFQEPAGRLGLAKKRLLVGSFFLLQPLARLWGRARHGQAPLSRMRSVRLTAPWPQSLAEWSEEWQSSAIRLETIETRLKADGVTVVRGGMLDRWDLEVRGGMLGGARLLTGIEEYGKGKQRILYRVWPQHPAGAVALALTWLVLSGLAFWNGAPTTGVILGLLAAMLTLRMLFESGASMAALRAPLRAGQPTLAGSPLAKEHTGLETK